MHVSNIGAVSWFSDPRRDYWQSQAYWISAAVLVCCLLYSPAWRTLLPCRIWRVEFSKWVHLTSCWRDGPQPAWHKAALLDFFSLLMSVVCLRVHIAPYYCENMIEAALYFTRPMELGYSLEWCCSMMCLALWSCKKGGEENIKKGVVSRFTTAMRKTALRLLLAWLLVSKGLNGGGSNTIRIRQDQNRCRQTSYVLLFTFFTNPDANTAMDKKYTTWWVHTN